MQTKVFNTRYLLSRLYHYAHFMVDCLYCEILNNIFNFTEVIREKTVNQSIGNFERLYTDLTGVKNIELTSKEFKQINIPTLFTYGLYSEEGRQRYGSRYHMDCFRHFIFNRYTNLSNETYPEVLLIKRYGNVELVSDPELKKHIGKTTTGSQRREITNINTIEDYLQQKYQQKFKSVYLELIPFEEQIKYFYNAKLIVMSHGAALVNSFFCDLTKKPTIVEVQTKYHNHLDIIFNTLNLTHKKCENKLSTIITLCDTLYKSNN